METLYETDNRLILASKLTCRDEGIHVGEVSEETIKNCRNPCSSTAAEKKNKDSGGESSGLRQAVQRRSPARRRFYFLYVRSDVFCFDCAAVFVFA